MPTAERYLSETPQREALQAEKRALQAQANAERVQKNGLPLGELLRLRCIHGLTYQMIARMYGVTKQAIQEALQPYISRISMASQAKAYQVREATFLAMLESELATDLLDPAKRQAASLNNVAYAFTQVNHARLLAQGKSTENISTRSVVMQAQQAISEISAELAQRAKCAIPLTQPDKTLSNTLSDDSKPMPAIDKQQSRSQLLSVNGVLADNLADKLVERIPDIALRLQLAEQAQLSCDITKPLDMTESDNV